MILDNHFKNKRYFNINSKEDIELFAQFMRNSTWGPGLCPFVLEFPYLSVPDMIKARLVEKTLKQHVD